MLRRLQQVQAIAVIDAGFLAANGWPISFVNASQRSLANLAPVKPTRSTAMNFGDGCVRVGMILEIGLSRGLASIPLWCQISYPQLA